MRVAVKQSDAKTCILYTETWGCQRQSVDGLNRLFRVGVLEAAELGPRCSPEMASCSSPAVVIGPFKCFTINKIEVRQTAADGASESILGGIPQHP
jgi:hypothetical protein